MGAPTSRGDEPASRAHRSCGAGPRRMGIAGRRDAVLPLLYATLCRTTNMAASRTPGRARHGRSAPHSKFPPRGAACQADASCRTLLAAPPKVWRPAGTVSGNVSASPAIRVVCASVSSFLLAGLAFLVDVGEGGAKECRGAPSRSSCPNAVLASSPPRTARTTSSTNRRRAVA